MTIHRVRLGPDLLQGARDDRPLTLLSIAVKFSVVLLCLPLLGILGTMAWYLWLAIHLRSTQAWSTYWEQSQGSLPIFIVVIYGPSVIATIRKFTLMERTARSYALLGDDHWAPALDVQPAPLTPDERTQDALDLGTLYAPLAGGATLAIAGGALLVALGGWLAYLFTWWVQQSPPVPPGDVPQALAMAAMMCAFVVGCIAGGGWLFWRGIRLNGGVHLIGDAAALHVYSRRGRERTRFAWHEIRAFSARLAALGSDRTTYYLDTGDRVLIWVESLFDPSAIRAQHALLRRTIVTLAGVPVRDISRVYTHIPAALGDLFLSRRNAHIQRDDAAPTEADLVLSAPFRALHRISSRLLLIGGALFGAALMLEASAFALQHLLSR